jgi:hypothetical protein
LNEEYVDEPFENGAVLAERVRVPYRASQD